MLWSSQLSVTPAHRVWTPNTLVLASSVIRTNVAHKHTHRDTNKILKYFKTVYKSYFSTQKAGIITLDSTGVLWDYVLKFPDTQNPMCTSQGSVQAITLFATLIVSSKIKFT